MVDDITWYVKLDLVVASPVSQTNSMAYFSHGNVGAGPADDPTETERNTTLSFNATSIAGSHGAASFHNFRSEELISPGDHLLTERVALDKRGHCQK